MPFDFFPTFSMECCPHCKRPLVLPATLYTATYFLSNLGPSTDIQKSVLAWYPPFKDRFKAITLHTSTSCKPRESKMMPLGTVVELGTGARITAEMFANYQHHEFVFICTKLSGGQHRFWHAQCLHNALVAFETSPTTGERRSTLSLSAAFQKLRKSSAIKLTGDLLFFFFDTKADLVARRTSTPPLEFGEELYDTTTVAALGSRAGSPELVTLGRPPVLSSEYEDVPASFPSSSAAAAASSSTPPSPPPRLRLNPPLDFSGPYAPLWGKDNAQDTQLAAGIQSTALNPTPRSPSPIRAPSPAAADAASPVVYATPHRVQFAPVTLTCCGCNKTLDTSFTRYNPSITNIQNVCTNVQFTPSQQAESSPFNIALHLPDTHINFRSTQDIKRPILAWRHGLDHTFSSHTLVIYDLKLTAESHLSIIQSILATLAPPIPQQDILVLRNATCDLEYLHTECCAIAVENRKAETYLQCFRVYFCEGASSA
jgi:hypothetical protein